jgi:nucleotide-binding universal stress UspA family protein
LVASLTQSVKGDDPVIDRILVGIDGSGPSIAALHWAIEHARFSGAGITLEHVARDDGDDVAEALLDDAATECLARGFDTDRVLARGVPEQVLVTDAAPGDLLVIGTHKTGFLRSRVLGMRTVAIATAARSSVVIVPELYSSRVNRVVVGVALGDRSRDAIVAGATEAARGNHELSLVHASTDAENNEECHALLEWAADVATTAAPTVTIRRRVSHRRCADALLDASRVASLLVIGADSAEGEVAGRIGTVTHEVVLNLNSPVLIVR